MLGVFVFNNIFNNLGEKCRNKILGNIFEISNVSVSDLVIRDSNIIFRIFSDDVFYQYIFDFNSSYHDSFIKVCCSKKIVNSIVLVNDFSNMFGLELLIEIFKCQNEYQIYQLVKKLL